MRKSTYFFFQIITLFIFCKQINAQRYDWVQTIRPGGNEHCWDITTDFNNNIFVTGRVKSTSIFGSGAFIQSPPYKSCCETDAFVAKYRPNGDLVWVSRDGGVEPDWGRAVTTDMNGNVFVTGEFSDTAYFGIHQIIAVGTYMNRNIFIAKYDSLGTCLWVKSAGNSAAHSRGYGVTVDSFGNSYVTGHISGTSNFDGIPFGIAGKNIPFVAKFSPLGACLWVKNIVVQYNGEGDNIRMGKDGNIVVVGGYKGTLTVNSIIYPGNSPSWADVFVIKMDTSGNFVWVATAVGAFQDQANAIDFDSSDNIYIAGVFANDLTFGTTTINSLGASSTAALANARADGFVAKYSEAGVFQWVKTIRNSVDGLVNDLTLNTLNVTRSDKILVGGSAWGNVDLVGIPLTLDTIYEGGLLTEFDSLGNLIWYKTTGGIDSSHFNVRGVTSDSYNNIYVGGGFTGNPYKSYDMSFDSIKTQSLNGFDGLIAKIAPPIYSIITIADTLICPGQNDYFNATQQDGTPLSCLWSFPGGIPASSTLLNPVVDYATAGTYTATLVVANGHVTDTSQITIMASLATCSTFIDEKINSFLISVSPNPASSIVTISLDGFNLQKNTRFQLYNYLGQEVGAPILIDDNIFNVNLEEVSTGAYFFKITQDNFAKTEKLLILKN